MIIITKQRQNFIFKNYTMNSKKAKQLRRMSEAMTVGQHPAQTKKVYRRLKSTAKEVKNEGAK